MPSMQEIQARIESVGVTRQIARAMQLVSNTKIRRCRELVGGSRPYFEENLTLLDTVVRASAGLGRAFEHREAPALYLVAGSDRGLCGGYNINVCKLAHSLMLQEPYGAELMALGSRAQEFFARRNVPLRRSFRGISQNPFYLDGREVADAVLSLFRSGEIGKVVLVYTVFETILNHRPTALTLLPLTRSAPEGPMVRMEPPEEALLEALLPDYLTGCIFCALAEGALCEQSARATSMDSAVKNCEELIGEMQMQYNIARQGAITQEINEIVSGAEAQNGA